MVRRLDGVTVLDAKGRSSEKADGGAVAVVRPVGQQDEEIRHRLVPMRVVKPVGP
jgi:hypothetical protein